MSLYAHQKPFLIAVDCIIFGFDGRELKLLLIKRGFEPEKNKWSLMGGFLHSDETLDEAAHRVLRQLTGLEGVYMEQLHVYSDVARDPEERTISVAYYALIDIRQYQNQLNEAYQAEWFLPDQKPALIFDHDLMVQAAQKEIRYKAALHPILFELLPQKFTIPQLQHLYEKVYDTLFDNRNFTRKLMSTGLLVKQKEKDKSGSKKGAYYYKLDKRKYKANLQAFLNLVPKPDKYFAGK